MTDSDSSEIGRTSFVVAALGDLRRLVRWLESSRIARAYKRLAVGFRTAARTSRLAKACTTLVLWLRHSSLYRWLTKDPEPNVIVIDLRETYTIGYFITVLDWLFPRVERAWDASRVRWMLNEAAGVVRDAPVQTVSVAVIVALLTNTLVAAGSGTLSATSVLARVAVLVVAVAGAHVRTSWDTVANAQTLQLLKAALKPPGSVAETEQVEHDDS